MNGIIDIKNNGNDANHENKLFFNNFFLAYLFFLSVNLFYL